MTSKLLKTALIGLGMIVGSPAWGAVILFVDNPTTNSSDFATSVGGLGGSITTLDFESHALGALDPNHYLGVTLNGTGNFASVVNSAGPGQGNISTAPTSSGEGLNAASNMLFANVQAGSLTVTFGAPVLGFGLFTVDLYNPGGANDVTLEIFSGANGTGASLGLLSAADFNLQRNFRYFMGVVSTDGNIGSAVFTSLGGGGDILALDNLQFATGGVSPVPEPTTLSLFGVGALFLAIRRVRRNV